MEKCFYPFRIAGKMFLAIPQYYGGAMIIDDSGNNYGSWMHVDTFKKNYKSGENAAIPATALSKCRLAVARD